MHTIQIKNILSHGHLLANVVLHKLSVNILITGSNLYGERLAQSTANSTFDSSIFSEISSSDYDDR